MKQFIKLKFTAYLLVTLFCMTSIVEAKKIMGAIYFKIYNFSNVDQLYARYIKYNHSNKPFSLVAPYVFSVDLYRLAASHSAEIRTLPFGDFSGFARMDINVTDAKWETNDEIISDNPEHELEEYFKKNSFCDNLKDSGVEPKLFISGSIGKITVEPTVKAEPIGDEDDTVYNIVVKCYIRQDKQKEKDKVSENINLERKLEIKSMLNI